MSHYRPYPKERPSRRATADDVHGRRTLAAGSHDWRSCRDYGRGRTMQDYLSVENPGQLTASELSWRSHQDRLPRSAGVLQEANGHRYTRNQDYFWAAKPTTPEPLMLTAIGKAQGNYNEQNVVPEPHNPVELIINNLDSNVKGLHNVLMSLISEHAAVHSLNLSSHSDGSPLALVRVASQQDARNVISQVQNYKLGFKRLTINYARNNSIESSQLKDMVISLLMDAPASSMPLYRLIHLLEDRYLANVSVSEVNKLKDICRIIEENGERIISLNGEVRSAPPTGLQTVHLLFCSVHCPNGLEASEEGLSDIPLVLLPLKEFTAKLNQLLTSHLGTLPLLSFAVCYKYEFGETLPISGLGVPLEHLVTCVNNVKLKYGGPNSNTKYVIRDMTLKTLEVKGNDLSLKSLSPSITSNIMLLSRELVELLKTQDRCQLQFNKCVPAYHHHFGRQLRVADYGFTKLGDLLKSETIANVVQIIGEGSRKTITMTHAAQMRRFTSDLLRVLKRHVSRQITADEFPGVYENVMNRQFSAVEYGLCFFEDLLEGVPNNIVVVSRSLANKISIAIPKREQTTEEIIGTKLFAEEVVKLLSYTPQCSMLFNKFVPAYHHHYGVQCKVSDYGFTTLIELFEAIPGTVKVEEMQDGERKLSLTRPKVLQVVGNQLTDLISHSCLSVLPLESLPSSFNRKYGYALEPSNYGYNDLNELVSQLSDYVKIIPSSAGPLLITVESGSQSTLALRVWAILVDPPHCHQLKTVVSMYNAQYQSNISATMLIHLDNVVFQINQPPNAEATIYLTPRYTTAAKLYLIVLKEGGEMPYNTLEYTCKKHYNTSLPEGTHEQLLTDFSFLIVLRRTRRRKLNISLNSKLAELGLPLSNFGPTNNNNTCVNWSTYRPPVYGLAVEKSNTNRTSPPKPDTPPSAGLSMWNHWESPKECDTNFNFEIHLPKPAETPSWRPMSHHQMISPIRNLLPSNLLQDLIHAPEPTELPLPEFFQQSGKDDSTDSGVNSSQTVSEYEIDLSSSEIIAKPLI